MNRFGSFALTESTDLFYVSQRPTHASGVRNASRKRNIHCGIICEGPEVLARVVDYMKMAVMPESLPSDWEAGEGTFGGPLLQHLGHWQPERRLSNVVRRWSI